MPLSKDATFNIRATDKTQKAFNSVNKSLRGVKQSAGRVSAALKGLAVGAVAAAGAAGLGAIVKTNLAAIDSLAKTADKLGVTTEALAGLRHAAELTGVQSEKLDMGLQRMTRRISEAAIGTGEAKAALIELGLSAQELNRMGPEEAFSRIADAMLGVENQTDRVRLAFKLFDSEGVALVNTLNLGSQGLAEMQQEAKELGISISRVDAAKIEQANDALTRMREAVAGIGRTITIALAPFITVISRRFTEAAKGAQEWRLATVEAIESVVRGIGYVSEAFRGLKLLWKTLELAFAGFVATISNGLHILTRDILAIAGYIPGIGDGINQVNDEIRSFAAKSRFEVNALSREVLDLATKEPASDGIKRFLNEVRLASREATEAITASSEKINDAARTTAIGVPVDTPAVTKNKIAVIKQDLKSVEDLNLAHHMRLAESLNIALNQRQAVQEVAHKAAFDAEKYWSNRRRSEQQADFRALAIFEKAYWYDKSRTVASNLVAITANVANSNRTMFNINKGAAIAQASIDAVSGAARTLSRYPWPLAPILAGVHLAAGIAKVRAIKSASFGGGGGGFSPISPGGGAPSSFIGGGGGGYGSYGNDSVGDLGVINRGRGAFDSQGNPIEFIRDDDGELRYRKKKSTTKQVNITINGNPTGQQVRDLIRSINQEVRDGATLVTT